jgi:hypothetical protein
VYEREREKRGRRTERERERKRNPVLNIKFIFPVNQFWQGSAQLMATNNTLLSIAVTKYFFLVLAIKIRA